MTPCDPGDRHVTPRIGWHPVLSVNWRPPRSLLAVPFPCRRWEREFRAVMSVAPFNLSPFLAGCLTCDVTNPDGRRLTAPVGSGSLGGWSPCSARVLASRNVRSRLTPSSLDSSRITAHASHSPEPLPSRSPKVYLRFALAHDPSRTSPIPRSIRGSVRAKKHRMRLWDTSAIVLGRGRRRDDWLSAP